jgi:hypothetical protein
MAGIPGQVADVRKWRGIMDFLSIQGWTCMVPTLLQNDQLLQLQSNYQSLKQLFEKSPNSGFNNEMLKDYEEIGCLLFESDFDTGNFIRAHEKLESFHTKYSDFIDSNLKKSLEKLETGISLLPVMRPAFLILSESLLEFQGKDLDIEDLKKYCASLTSLKDVAENFVELINWLDPSRGRAVVKTFKELSESLVRWDLGESIAGLQEEQEILDCLKSIKLYAKSILWDIQRMDRSLDLESKPALNFPEVKANVSREEQILCNQGAIDFLRSLRARKLDPEQSKLENEASERLRATIDSHRPEGHKLFSSND